MVVLGGQFLVDRTWGGGGGVLTQCLKWTKQLKLLKALFGIFLKNRAETIDSRFHSSISSSRLSKLWSNGSASGSSSGSWYWAKYEWARESAAVMRLSVSKTSIFSRRSTAKTSTIKYFIKNPNIQKYTNTVFAHAQPLQSILIDQKWQ